MSHLPQGEEGSTCAQRARTEINSPADVNDIQRFLYPSATHPPWEEWKSLHPALLGGFLQYRDPGERRRMVRYLLPPHPLRRGLRTLTLPSRDCPRCKVKRRASKELSLARLPPILLIHLKRFEANGRFSDKIDTFVDFPMKSLDLTGFMPPPLPVGADQTQLNGGLPMSSEDPRIQLPPYRYDLYGVTNHYGNLTSGHCERYRVSLTI